MSPGLPVVITTTLNPAMDLTLTVPSPRLGVLNRARSLQRDASGKGINVSLALAGLGVPSTAVALLGGLTGHYIERELIEKNITLEAFPVGGETRYNLKIVDELTRQLTEFNTPGPRVTEEELAALEERLLHLIQAGCLVIFSGSLPDHAPLTLYRDLAKASRQRGAVVLVDSSGEALRLALEAGPYLIKPNRAEAEDLLGFPLSTGSALRQAIELLHTAGASRVVLSLGAHGAIFSGPEGCYRVQPPQVEVRSTAGCGDALLAGIAVGLVSHWNWQETSRFATAVAAATVEMPGTTFPSRGRVEELLPKVRVETLDWH